VRTDDSVRHCRKAARVTSQPALPTSVVRAIGSAGKRDADSTRCARTRGAGRRRTLTAFSSRREPDLKDDLRRPSSGQAARLGTDDSGSCAESPWIGVHSLPRTGFRRFCGPPGMKRLIYSNSLS
jgi:hypothetical protein